MKECITHGYIPYSIPRGYSNTNKGKAMEQQIIVNTEGKLLRKAFHWKVEKQMRNCEIIRELAKLGLKIDDRRLCEMFKNPFYCGILVSKLTPGEVYSGNHEPLISHEMFLRANNVVLEARSHPVSHNTEDANLPLKRFMKCGKCGTPMTGFLVRKKGLWYYKCRIAGCRTVKSAKHVHNEFKILLESFEVDENETQIVKEGIAAMYEQYFEENTQTQRTYKSRIKELKVKIDVAEEQLVAREITREMFDKYHVKFTTEITEIEKMLHNQAGGSSNLQKCLNIVLNFCQKPLQWWENANIGERMMFQNMLFPGGISYEPKTEKVQTNLINALFAPIPVLTRVYVEKKKGRTSVKTDSPFGVTSSGFKPETSTAVMWCSIQLSYEAFLQLGCNPFAVAKIRTFYRLTQLFLTFLLNFCCNSSFQQGNTQGFKCFERTSFYLAFAIVVNNPGALLCLLTLMATNFDQGIDHMVKRIEVVVENDQIALSHQFLYHRMLRSVICFYHFLKLFNTAKLIKNESGNKTSCTQIVSRMVDNTRSFVVRDLETEAA